MRGDGDSGRISMIEKERTVCGFRTASREGGPQGLLIGASRIIKQRYDSRMIPMFGV